MPYRQYVRSDKLENKRPALLHDGERGGTKRMGNALFALFFIEYQVKPLGAIEPEAGVAGDEGHLLGNGVGNDYMVRRVFMSLRLVDFHTGIGLHVFLFQGKNLNIKFIFDGRHHSFHRLPSLEHKPLLR